jgi:hypothetical protein
MHNLDAITTAILDNYLPVAITAFICRVALASIDPNEKKHVRQGVLSACVAIVVAAVLLEQRPDASINMLVAISGAVGLSGNLALNALLNLVGKRWGMKLVAEESSNMNTPPSPPMVASDQRPPDAP